MQKTYCSYFPRSGGNYLALNYGNYILSDVVHSHEQADLDNDLCFSVIRSPDDAISSLLVLSLSQRIDRMPGKTMTRDQKVELLESLSKDYIGEYVAFYSNKRLLEIPVCSFNNVIADIIGTCQKISAALGQSGTKFIPKQAESRPGFVKTSKPIDDYGLSRSVLLSNNMSEAFSVYQKISNLTI